MLTNEELMAEWVEDCKIDQTRLSERMSSHPIRHSKYLTYLQTYKIKLRTLSLQYQKRRQIMTKYYNGEMDEDELLGYKLKQYLYKKPLRSEMESLLDADESLQLIKEKILYVETMVQACESILKDIGNQYYLFKSIVDQNKFLSGV
jgi:hypothetical protein